MTVAVKECMWSRTWRPHWSKLGDSLASICWSEIQHTLAGDDPVMIMLWRDREEWLNIIIFFNRTVVDKTEKIDRNLRKAVGKTGTREKFECNSIYNFWYGRYNSQATGDSVSKGSVFRPFLIKRFQETPAPGGSFRVCAKRFPQLSPWIFVT